MRKLITVLFLLLTLTACDDMQMQDVMHDLTGAPEGMVLIPAGEVLMAATRYARSARPPRYAPL